MWFSPRRRAVIAILVTWPIAYFYIDFASFVLHDIIDLHRRGVVNCDGSWRASLNGCVNFSESLAWTELILTTVIVLIASILLARWVVYPVRQLADMVGRFGPTSLGLRIRADGPRDETRQLSDEIDAMLDRLTEGYEAQRRFASNASHELRTPLATQRALIEVSLSSQISAEQLELLSRQLLSTNERNERLIDGLLTLAETDRGLVVSTPVRLDVLVGEAVANVQALASDADLQIAAKLAPTTVTGEVPLLERLATNLISNAIKYNVPGGAIEVRVDPAGVLAVSNTGPVVPPELVAGLFEPFRRMTGERLDHGGGVGLGLTIARSIVTAHGARMDARANPGGGLSIEVRFPLDARRQQAAGYR
jgi:signal transduction histidine kinase